MNIEIMRFNTVLILLISAFSNLLTSQDYDLIILNGSIYDGSGSAPYTSDLGIKGLKIISIGKLNTSCATKVIDATGLALSPGFIDLHAHLEPILQMPGAESHVRLGVTLALGGPDGGSLWPFGEELEEISKKQLGMNVAFLAGHNTIRKNIMNLDNREPTPEELDKMKSQVAQAMEEGAFGLSTGLKYLPGTFSKVDEVIELAKVAARYGGFYTSHLREEGLGLIDAVKEAIMIGKEANIPVVLTHHKAIGKPSWGKSVETLKLVDEANRSGLDIQIDQYPYTPAIQVYQSLYLHGL